MRRAVAGLVAVGVCWLAPPASADHAPLHVRAAVASSERAGWLVADARPALSGAQYTVLADGDAIDTSATPLVGERTGVSVIMDAAAPEPVRQAGASGVANFVLQLPDSVTAAVVADRDEPAVLAPPGSASAAVSALVGMRGATDRATGAAISLALQQFPSGARGRLVVMHTAAAEVAGEPAERLAERLGAAGAVLVVVVPAGTPTQYWSAVADATGGLVVRAEPAEPMTAFDRVAAVTRTRHRVSFSSRRALPASVSLQARGSDGSVTEVPASLSRPAGAATPTPSMSAAPADSPTGSAGAAPAATATTSAGAAPAATPSTAAARSPTRAVSPTEVRPTRSSAAPDERRSSVVDVVIGMVLILIAAVLIVAAAVGAMVRSDRRAGLSRGFADGIGGFVAEGIALVRDATRARFGRDDEQLRAADAAPVMLANLDRFGSGDVRTLHPSEVAEATGATPDVAPRPATASTPVAPTPAAPTPGVPARVGQPRVAEAFAAPLAASRPAVPTSNGSNGTSQPARPPVRREREANGRPAAAAARTCASGPKSAWHEAQKHWLPSSRARAESGSSASVSVYDGSHAG